VVGYRKYTNDSGAFLRSMGRKLETRVGDGRKRNKSWGWKETVIAVTVLRVHVQPVPWKMRLRMLVGILIEILNGGEILVN